jgi:hypothetical protein
VNRVNGSVDLKASFVLRLTRRTYLGTTLGAAYLPVYQRFLVEGRPVFSPPPLTLTWAGQLGVDLF